MRSRFRMAIAFVGAAVALSVPSRADASDQEVCLSSYASGQRLLRAGRLKDARKDFAVCGGDDCSAVLKRDCTAWLAEVEEKMPTVVVTARDPDGHPVGGGRVVFDGQEPGEPIDGRLLEVDPGPHVVRFIRPGQTDIETSFVIREATKGRHVEVVVPGSNAPRETTAPLASEGPRAASRPWLAFASAGVAAAATASFAFFALSGRSAQSEQLDPCRGRCSEEQIDDVRRYYVAADISLAVAVVSAGLATTLFLLHHDR